MRTLTVSFSIAAAIGSLAPQSEPAPRQLTPLPLQLSLDLAEVGGVRELANGRLLVSDANTPAILVVDPATGAARKLGREGKGPNEYGRPGGIYPDADGTTWLVMDRSAPRVFVVDRAGTLTGMRSIEQRGARSTSDHVDPMRIDAALHTYFVDRGAAFRAQAGRPVDSLPLIRFDVARQHGDTVARLFFTKPTTVTTKDRLTMTRTPVFSPADGWTVMADGSVAVVRAVPYRVDWIAASGERTVGPPIDYTPVAVTDADRKAFDAQGSPMVSGGRPGSTGMTAGGGDSKVEFAKVKPPFDPDAVVAAPDGRVWVGRHVAAGSTQVVYDVFDRRGARVDRVALPARSKVVGFGRGVVYAVELDDDDLPRIRRYRLTN